MSEKLTIVCIDDERSFQAELEEGSDIHYARTSADGIALLKDLQEKGVEVAEIWLDHDLGETNEPPYWDTIMPVVAWLEELGHAGTPYPCIGIVIHTMNFSAVPAMNAALSPYYHVTRESPIRMFR